jgi:hypothetical protein
MQKQNDSNRASRTIELDYEDAVKTVGGFFSCTEKAVLKKSNVSRV